MGTLYNALLLVAYKSIHTTVPRFLKQDIDYFAKFRSSDLQMETQETKLSSKMINTTARQFTLNGGARSLSRKLI